MTETDLILATVMRWYPPRLWAVCDRVSWGLGLNYEADAIAISKSGLADELEAKSTLPDLRADLKKHKWKLIDAGQRQHFADRFWYVVPPKLGDAAVEQARSRGFGVVVVTDIQENGRVIRQAERVLKASKLRGADTSRRRSMIERRADLWRLAALRYWDAQKRVMELVDELRKAQVKSKIR
jgi:hypothetical protein